MNTTIELRDRSPLDRAPHFGRGETGFTRSTALRLAARIAEQLPVSYAVGLGDEPYNKCYPVKIVDPAGRIWCLYTARHVSTWIGGENAAAAAA